MNHKELTKTFMMISNLIKPLGPHGLHKKIQRLKGYGFVPYMFLQYIYPLAF